MQVIHPQNISQNIFEKPLSIDDFDLIKPLSKSRFGQIMLSKYKKTGAHYAVKSLEQKIFKNKDSEIDYLREKEILYDLTKRNHPHIVKLYADFEDANYRYLVMELIEGTSLDKLRGKAPGGYVEQNLVIHILTQLLETLAYLHDTCHIINRDIKPENIMLDKDNNIKITDFGLAAYLVHQNRQLVSNKSLKGAIKFVPPEIIFYPPPLNYDYKIDVFSLGFTIYSLMNPSQDGKQNLPMITEGRYGNMRRYENKLINKFYDTWLIDFVKLLYENDRQKRPTATGALNLLNKFKTDPKTIEYYQNMINNENKELNNLENNNRIINNISTNIPSNNNNLAEKQNQPQEISQPYKATDNSISSSMKSLLLILSKLDCMNSIIPQLNSLINNNNQLNQQLFFIKHFFEILNIVKQWENGQINQETFDKLVNEFFSLNLNNNISVQGNRPIILLYMISSIIKNEFQQYFNNIYQNNIYDNIIQNNFKDLNNIIPMNNKYVYNLISQKILAFKNEYKGPFVDNFYFLILFISKCPSCGKIFGINELRIAQFLQLDVPNPVNNLTDLIRDFFTPFNGFGNYYCKKCGCKVQISRQKYCLNLPNYLFLEFEDKNKINFSDRITVPLYNGQNYYYQYCSSIYKGRIDGSEKYSSIIKIGNDYYLYSNDKIEKCSIENIYWDCPSLALYKKINQ